LASFGYIELLLYDITNDCGVFLELYLHKKENDGAGIFNLLHIVRTYVNVTMYPQYNNNKKF
jgi:hypothetical protein